MIFRRKDNFEYDNKVIPIEYGYNRMKEAIKSGTLNNIRTIRNDQTDCIHNFGSTEICKKKEFIHNPNNSRAINVINFIISNIVNEPEYKRICKNCGRVEYFYAEDEAESMPSTGTKLFYFRRNSK